MAASYAILKRIKPLKIEEEMGVKRRLDPLFFKELCPNIVTKCYFQWKILAITKPNFKELKSPVFDRLGFLFATPYTV